MANFIISLFQQLDRAFPLQGVDADQHNKQRAGVELRARSTSLPIMDETGLGVAGSAAYDDQPNQQWFDLPHLPTISPSSSLSLLDNLGVDVAGQPTFQTHNFD